VSQGGNQLSQVDLHGVAVKMCPSD